MQVSTAIHSRLTGRRAVPWISEDAPAKPCPPFQRLLRYMSEWKFSDLLEKNALWLTRAPFLGEPMECRLSLPGELAIESDADRRRREVQRISSNPEATRLTYRLRRIHAFVSCWNQSHGETLAMWREYVDKPAKKRGDAFGAGVVIVTNRKSLTLGLPSNINYGAVTYHPKNIGRSDLGTLAFFYKPESYLNEREFRLVYNEPFQDFSPFLFRKLSKQDKRGRHFPLTVRDVIHRVITHPRANGAFKARVDALLRDHLPDIHREDSALP